MRTFRTLIRAGLLAALVAPLTGCLTSTPAYDNHFGEAVRLSRSMQILNPDAAMNTDPVTGIDGKAATASMDRYNTSFRTPPQALDAFTIGVRTSSGNQGR